MNKMKKLLRDNPIIIAMLMLMLLLGSMLMYMKWQQRNQVVATAEPEELWRTETVEGIEDPAELVRYMLAAVKEKDLDMFLRGCPIDEISLKQDDTKALDQAGVFSLESTIAPSNQYEDYLPISSAELTGKYAEQFTQLVNYFQESGNPDIKEIAYVMPASQLESDYQWNSMKESEILGASARCEMMALLETGERQYIVGVTLASYYDYWKVVSMQSALLSEQNEICFKESTTHEFEQVKESSKQKKLADLLKKNKEGEQDSSDAKKVKQKIAAEDMLLPANYFLANASYGETPEAVIEQFTLAVEKKDLTAAISYGNMSGKIRNLQNVTENSLEEQADFAREVKRFYYSLLRGGKPVKEEKLEELGMTGKEVIRELDPQYAFYLELKKIKKAENKGEYLGYYYYMGKHYEVKFTLVQLNEGWQIKEISDAKQLTKKAAKEILE